jgi:hypothetical protein
MQWYYNPYVSTNQIPSPSLSSWSFTLAANSYWAPPLPVYVWADFPTLQPNGGVFRVGDVINLETTQQTTSTTGPITTPKPTTAPITTPKPTTAPIATPKPTTAPITTPKPTPARMSFLIFLFILFLFLFLLFLFLFIFIFIFLGLNMFRSLEHG